MDLHALVSLIHLQETTLLIGCNHNLCLESSLFLSCPLVHSLTRLYLLVAHLSQPHIRLNAPSAFPYIYLLAQHP